MPAKGGNAKAESSKAKKAANEDKKAQEAAAAAEAREAAAWDDGKPGKGKKENAQEKKAAEAAKKAERERLLKEEEESIPDGAKKGAAKKEGGKAAAKKSQPPKQPKNDFGDLDGDDSAPTSFSASNIDDALDALSIATEKTDKATQGSKAAGLERHPERRFKAAFEAYKEREMTRIKQERPNMRTQQYHDALYKEFQKSPENPFNQLTVSYDATKDEKLEALQSKRSAIEKRLAQ